MNLELAASSIRKIVEGETPGGRGAQGALPGLADMLRPEHRDRGVLLLGRLLGIADVLQCLKDKGPTAT